MVYTGTFDEFQGVDYLMAAFRIVHEHDRSVKLILVGSTINPAHRARYEKMAMEMGIGFSVVITRSCRIFSRGPTSRCFHGPDQQGFRPSF